MIRVLVSARPAIVRAGLDAVIRDAPGLIPAGAIAPERLESTVAAEPVDAVVALVEGNQDEAAAAELVAAAGGAAVVLLLTDPLPAFAVEALRAGVRAVLPADRPPAEIVAAIEAAAAGLLVLHPMEARALLAAPVFSERAPAAPGQALTPREIEVLRLMADGEGNKGIAWKLGISEHTVKFHVGSIMGKLNAASRTEAVTLGMRRGFILL